MGGCKYSARHKGNRVATGSFAHASLSAFEGMAIPVFENFSHFLAYGSTDQETLRDLTHDYEGLIVPGTIAAYQAEGTRGFVLSLSAAIQKPYAIDPRTPLFQYPNPAPKQSHLALAQVLGLENVVAEHRWAPPDVWTPGFRETVASAWLNFNSAYTTIAPKQFDKYARRLGRRPQVGDARGPSTVFAPYLMEDGSEVLKTINDGLWDAMLAASGPSPMQLRRVVAAASPAVLVDRVRAAKLSEVAIWVDNLDEVEPANANRLLAYADAVNTLSREGFSLFALYGGFFAAALRTVGLGGASHGVGFSEHRDHVELKTSGGAPARFYVQRIHRYLPVEVASEIWRQRPELVDSFYPDYISREPAAYTYHELMKHSVRARADEIRRMSDMSPGEVANELESTRVGYQSALDLITLPTPIERRVRASLLPLVGWANALRYVAGRQ